MKVQTIIPAFSTTYPVNNSGGSVTTSVSPLRFSGSSCCTWSTRRLSHFPALDEDAQLQPVSRNQTVPRCELSLTEVVNYALLTKYPGEDISRVIQSFTDAMDGKSLEVDRDKPSHQRATSFISGLKSVPFHEYGLDGDFGWVGRLEEHWKEIHDELMNVMSQTDIEEKGNNVWAPPVVEAANSYGPNWRTLVLQNREWDPINTKLFPRTTELLQDEGIGVPSVEAFFARQPPTTGIKLHTDDCNFILTMHLGLQVPTPPASWIEVAGQRHAWEQGKSLVFDTSFYHQTMNEDENTERIVLLIRFWHPKLTLIERDAISYLFRLIEDPDNDQDIIEAKQSLTKRSSSKRSKSVSTPARGFGK